MGTSGRRLPLLLAAALLPLSGCVALEDYDRKVSEATALRRDLEAVQARLGSQTRTVETLRKQLEERRLENEELAQSLTMARRHSQQTETRVADLRAQTFSQKQEAEKMQERAAELEKGRQESLAKTRQLEASLNEVRGKLLRFEDKLRLQDQLEKDLAAQFAEEARAGTVKVQREGDRVVLVISSTVLFASGSVAIKSQGNNLLAKVARVLRRYTNREVQVHGHTDNVRISERLAERWETNWELSAGRATRVLRYLVEVGNLDPRRASAAGLGEFRPIADNATPEGREKNRRIEIVIFPPESA